MSRLIWNQVGLRTFESGVDRGVLYLPSRAGEAWDGLVSISEKPAEQEVETAYLDGVPYLQKINRESFEAEIEAYTYPESFDQVTSFHGAQPAKPFGFSYRTRYTNDLGQELTRIHLVYGALAKVSMPSTTTLNGTPNISLFAWSIKARPFFLAGHAPTSHIIIDEKSAWHEAVTALTNALYGTSSTNPRLPSPEEVLAIFYNNATLRIIDHGDGTWTAIGPDDVVKMLSATEFQINWPSAVYLNSTTYQVSNY